MDLYSPLVPVEVIAPIEHSGAVIGELDQWGGAIEDRQFLADKVNVRAKIPAASLKRLEI